LSVTLFEKVPILQALKKTDHTFQRVGDPNQLLLFDL